MSDEIHKLCRGCHIFENRHLYSCPILKNNKIEFIKKCPCRECIVKSICITTCRPYTILHDELVKKWLGENTKHGYEQIQKEN